MKALKLDGRVSIDAVGFDLNDTLVGKAPEYQILPGARELILALSKQDVLLGIATDSAGSSVNIIFTTSGLPRGVFDVILPGDAMAERRRKPDPYQWEEFSRFLNVQARYILAVENTPAGVVSAKAAGCHTCGITTTHNEAELWTAGADLVVAHLAELAARLGL